MQKNELCRPPPATTLISIEGNISSGKSTNIRKLKTVCAELGRDDVVVLEEPVKEWVDKGFLATMYDQQRQPVASVLVPTHGPNELSW